MPERFKKYIYACTWVYNKKASRASPYSLSSGENSLKKCNLPCKVTSLFPLINSAREEMLVLASLYCKCNPISTSFPEIMLKKNVALTRRSFSLRMEVLSRPQWGQGSSTDHGRNKTLCSCMAFCTPKRDT